MESQDPMKTMKPPIEPKISVLIPAMRGYHSVLAAVEAWEGQTRRDALEILVLAPDSEGADRLPPGQRVVETGDLTLHQMRAAGVRAATADHVMIAEDHCFPDPNWSEIMLPRLDEGWDGMGGALCSGDPSSAGVQAPFLLGYGQWILPETGPTHILPGHNAIWRKDLLLDLGEALPTELLIMTFFVQRMHKSGKRIFVESEALMRHFDPTGMLEELRIMTCGGLGFGAIRTQDWNPLLKLLYLGAAPLIGGLHWKRTLREHLRTRGASGLNDLSLLHAIPLALAWGCGESLGAIMGIQGAAKHTWRSEIKPPTRERVAAAMQAVGLAGNAEAGDRPSMRHGVDDVVGTDAHSQR